MPKRKRTEALPDSVAAGEHTLTLPAQAFAIPAQAFAIRDKRLAKKERERAAKKERERAAKKERTAKKAAKKTKKTEKAAAKHTRGAVKAATGTTTTTGYYQLRRLSGKPLREYLERIGHTKADAAKLAESIAPVTKYKTFRDCL